ncbi:MAG: hypothetical protein IJU60_04025 [Acholeplasmatales bacterium]|nr:hypothetical protein [Acholeplasmatales bacterium]
MEQKEQKTNPFLKGLKAFGHYIKFVFVDFFTSFKYNNMKLPAILIAIPGIFLGFFLIFHIPTVRNVIASYTRPVEGTAGSYVIEVDADAPDQTYYKIKMDNLSYNNKSYNLVLIRDYVEKEGTKLPTPENVKATLDGEKLTVNCDTPTGEGADKIVDYTLTIYEYMSMNYYPVKVVNNYVYGSAVDVSELGKLTYFVDLRANAASNDATYVNSAKSAKASFDVTTDGSKYNATNFKNVKYAGVYHAVSGLDDTLTSYKVELKGSEIAITYANNVEQEASYEVNATTLNLTARETVHILPFNYSGMILFVLMLLGIINIFFSLSVSGKKNLGSVVKATVTTVGILICSIFYIVAIFATEATLKDPTSGLNVSVESIINQDAIMSILFVIISVVTSIAGCVLGFIFYDRNYEKVTY